MRRRGAVRSQVSRRFSGQSDISPKTLTNGPTAALGAVPESAAVRHRAAGICLPPSARRRMHEFMFATGIENSYPTIALPDGTAMRVDEMEKTGHYERWRE